MLYDCDGIETDSRSHPNSLGEVLLMTMLVLLVCLFTFWNPCCPLHLCNINYSYLFQVFWGHNSKKASFYIPKEHNGSSVGVDSFAVLCFYLIIKCFVRSWRGKKIGVQSGMETQLSKTYAFRFFSGSNWSNYFYRGTTHACFPWHLDLKGVWTSLWGFSRGAPQ